MKKVFNYFVYLFAIIGFVLVTGYFAVKTGFTNEKGIIDEQRNSFAYIKKESAVPMKEETIPPAKMMPSWVKSEEWLALREAVLRDKDPIRKAAAAFDIEPRLIVSVLIVEQLRLFNDNRELFKTVFAPLKILGTQSQFSWGVMGIKQETAVETENNLRDPSSPFYLGQGYAHILDFTTNDPDKERFERLVNEKDRYYSYLYSAAILKEVEVQWKNAGYDIKNRPEIMSTLYNIGFKHSNPNPNPRSGGAQITIGNSPYSFGSLSMEFYYSDELMEEFPR